MTTLVSPGQLRSRRVVTQESFDSLGEAQFDTRHVSATADLRYVGLETIQEYQCVGQTACEAGDYELVREFLWGDAGRFPEPVAMVWHYDIQPVPPPDPPPEIELLPLAIQSLVDHR